MYIKGRHESKNHKHHTMTHTTPAKTIISGLFNVHETQAQAWMDNFKRSDIGFVYAAYSPSNGVKIGMTEGSPRRRVKALNTCVKDPYVLISTIKATDRRSMETLMHSFLQPQRVGEHNQELFDVEPEFVKKLFLTVKKLKRALSKTKNKTENDSVNKQPQEDKLVLGNVEGIRMVVLNGVVNISAIDFVAVMMGINAQYASNKIFDLTKHRVHGPSVIKLLERKHKFLGMGQKFISVLTFKEAIKFMYYLPKTNTAEIWEYIIDIFMRLNAGDSKLIKNLKQNANNDGLAQITARKEFGIDKKTNLEQIEDEMPKLKKRRLMF